MAYVTIEDAGGQLAHLIDQANSGEEVIITSESVPVARVVPVPLETPVSRRGGFGSGRYALIYIADDFDAPAVVRV